MAHTTNPQASSSVWEVAYEWRRLVGRAKWVKSVDLYASYDDAKFVYENLLSQKDYRNVTMTARPVYRAGIHADGIAKRNARLAAEA